MSVRALLARLRQERGFAVPTVLMMSIVGLGMGSATLYATVQVQSGTTRDTNVKQAIAAADAGLNRAVFRENKIVTTSTLKCVLVQTGALVAGLPSGDGWCPAVTGTVGTTTYSYRVKPWALVTLLGRQGRQVTIVSTGTSGGISRRVSEVAFAPLSQQVFGNERLIGRDSITFSGQSRTDVAVGTNGDITASGSALLCNDLRHGPGKTVTYSNSASQCAGYSVSSGTVDLPIPDQSAALASSDTSRFFTLDPKTSTVTWDAATRTLTMSSNGTLTLGGSNYSLCKLVMSGNSTLYMASGAHAKLFFDSPEACGLPSGTAQISVTHNGSNVSIESTAFNPAGGNYDLLGMYMVGSDTLTTTATIDSNGASDEFVLYAPRTDVTLTGQGNMDFYGAYAGKTMTVSNNAYIHSISGMPSPDVSSFLLYTSQRYVECTGGTGSPNPDSDC